MPFRASHVLHALLRSAGWQDAPVERLRFVPAPGVLPTRLPIASIAAGTIAASGLAAAALRHRCGGALQEVGVDLRAAALAMAASDFLLVDGRAVKTWSPATGYYPVRDGRWVYLHGEFPHLLAGLARLFGAEPNRDSIAARMAGWSAEEVETACGEQGLCGVVTRTRAQWAEHPQCRATAALPVVSIERIGDGPPLAPGAGARPLDGVRVLDLSRLIAGPMAGRTLAEHGADVMLVSGPHLPSSEPLVIDTGFGKRAAAIDLRTAEGDATLRRLVAGADVFIDAYRPGSLAARGYSAGELARLRPGIVNVSISAFSQAGPWRARRGYDSLVCATTGLTTFEGGREPKRLPCQPLDYLTGYLGAFGAMVALLRRSVEGGSWKVTLSLERTAAWMWEMTDLVGMESTPAAAFPSVADVADLCLQSDSPFGRLSYLGPVARLVQTPGGWRRAPVPLGSDPPQWTATD